MESIRKISSKDSMSFLWIRAVATALLLGCAHAEESSVRINKCELTMQLQSSEQGLVVPGCFKPLKMAVTSSSVLTDQLTLTADAGVSVAFSDQSYKYKADSYALGVKNQRGVSLYLGRMSSISGDVSTLVRLFSGVNESFFNDPFLHQKPGSDAAKQLAPKFPVCANASKQYIFAGGLVSGRPAMHAVKASYATDSLKFNVQVTDYDATAFKRVFELGGSYVKDWTLARFTMSAAVLSPWVYGEVSSYTVSADSNDARLDRSLVRMGKKLSIAYLDWASSISYLTKYGSESAAWHFYSGLDYVMQDTFEVGPTAIGFGFVSQDYFNAAGTRARPRGMMLGLSQRLGVQTVLYGYYQYYRYGAIESIQSEAPRSSTVGMKVTYDIAKVMK